MASAHGMSADEVGDKLRKIMTSVLPEEVVTESGIVTDLMDLWEVAESFIEAIDRMLAHGTDAHVVCQALDDIAAAFVYHAPFHIEELATELPPIRDLLRGSS